MKTAHEGTAGSSCHREVSEQEGWGATIGKWGKRDCNNFGSNIQTWMTTNLSKFSRENLSIESLLLGLCLEF